MDDKMYALDSKDKKILYLLHKNCRLSNSQIGRMVGLSKDGVKYRINKFISDGLLRGFFLNLRTVKQGYAAYVVFLRLRQVDAKSVKEIISLLAKKRYVIYCATCFGKWDISLQILSKSIFTFEKYMGEVIEIIGPRLSNYETFISIKEYKVYSSLAKEYFGGIKLNYKEPETKPFKKIKLDKLDKDIFKLLAEDARTPLHIIAKKTNKSLDVVRYRIKRFESNGYIYNYGILLDHAKLGYSLNTLFLYIQNMAQHKEKEFENFAKQSQYIRWAHKTTGQNIIIIEALTDSQRAFQDLISSIKNKFSGIISSYDSVLEFENHKDITLPDLDEIDDGN